MLENKNKQSIKEIKEKFYIVNGKTFKEIKTINNINKGHAGQILEQALGIPNGTDNLDLSDGELKTGKVEKTNDGTLIPKETLAICLIGKCMNDIIKETPFDTGNIFYEKIKDILYVPIIKIEDKIKLKADEWRVQNYIHFSLHDDGELLLRIKQDYIDICTEIKKRIISGNKINTINGRNSLLQIRTKASKTKNKNEKEATYKPLIHNGKIIADKTYAFYFTTSFLKILLTLQANCNQSYIKDIDKIKLKPFKYIFKQKELEKIKILEDFEIVKIFINEKNIIKNKVLPKLVKININETGQMELDKNIFFASLQSEMKNKDIFIENKYINAEKICSNLFNPYIKNQFIFLVSSINGNPLKIEDMYIYKIVEISDNLYEKMKNSVERIITSMNFDMNKKVYTEYKEWYLELNFVLSSNPTVLYIKDYNENYILLTNNQMNFELNNDFFLDFLQKYI